MLLNLKVDLSTQILDAGNGATPPDLFESPVILRGRVYPAPGGRCRVLKQTNNQINTNNKTKNTIKAGGSTVRAQNVDWVRDDGVGDTP